MPAYSVDQRIRGTEPTTGVVVLSWNSRGFIADCLESVRLHEPSVRLYVVDNGSTDGSVRFLHDRFSDITLIENVDNLGFAGGSNVGIRRALADGCDYILLLNNDTIIDEPFVTKCVDLCRADASIGIIGPAIVQANDPDTVQCLGGNICLWTLAFRYRSAGEPYVRRDELSDVGYVLGAAMLIKRQVLEQVGLLDPEYFPAYVEEADLCYRAKAQGFRTVVYHGCRVRHLGEMSSGGALTSYQRFAINTLRFGFKHLGPTQFAVASHLVVWRACYRKIVKHRTQ